MSKYPRPSTSPKSKIACFITCKNCQQDSSTSSAAMKIVHSNTTANHRGVYRTFKKLIDFYWFPNALQFCWKYIQSCPTYQCHKSVLCGCAHLAANPLATKPFERVSVDLIDLTSANNGDKYVLTVIDELTRFMQLVPMSSKAAHTVADALISNDITLFGRVRKRATRHRIIQRLTAS